MDKAKGMLQKKAGKKSLFTCRGTGDPQLKSFVLR